MNQHFSVPRTDEEQEFTGERYVPSVRGRLRTEHVHRYLFATRLAAGLDVLDVACGEGYGTFTISQAARSIIGVDIANDVIQRANAVYGSPNVSFRHGDAESLPLDDGSVDVVVSFETIEHVPHPEKMLAEVRRVLRGNGCFVVSTPDANAQDGMAHMNNPFHIKEFTRAEFVDLLHQYFKHVTILEQRFLHGSAMVLNPPLTHGRSFVEHFESNDGSAYKRTDDTIGDSYFLAIASDTEVSLPGASVLSDYQDLRALEDEFQYAVSALHSTQSELEQLRQDIHRVLTAVQASTYSDTELVVNDQGVASLLNQIRSSDVARRLAQSHAAYLRQRLRDLGEE